MKKRFLSLIIALAMMVGVFTPLIASYAAGESTEKGAKTSSVVLHKILQTKTNFDNAKFPGTKGLNNKDYDGNAIQDLAGFFGKGSEEIDGVYFAVQNTKGEYIDKSGNKLAIQDPTTAGFADQANILGGLTKANGLTLDVSKLPQEKTEYKIVEIVGLSTYKGDAYFDKQGNRLYKSENKYYKESDNTEVKAADVVTKEKSALLAASKAVPVKITLPLTNERGVVGTAHVYPKNTDEKPEIDKNFAKKHGLQVIEDTKQNNNAGADYKNYQAEKATVTAELGKEVPYEVKTKVNAGSRYQTLNWKDNMTNGLTLLTDSIQLATSPELSLTKGTDYKIKADDRGFTLSITAEGFKKINAKTHPDAGKGEDVEFTLTYKAKVNKNAVHDIPEKNDIKLEYSNNPDKEKEDTPVTPKDGELKVTKTWSDGTTKDVQVVYTLTNGTKSYAVMLDGNKTSGTVELGDGITFEITGAYAGTFKGEALKTGNDWKISERVAGYNETITVPESVTGQVAINNTKDDVNPTPLNPTEPKVVYYGKRFVKADEKDGKRLQGAEFVVKQNNKYLALKGLDTTKGEGKALADAKKAYDDAVKAWNDAVKAQSDKKDEEVTATINGKSVTGKTAAEAEIKNLQGKYETAFKKAKNAYTWVDSKDAANVVKLVSNEKGMFEITGLEKGTYLLEETKAPAGYATRNDQEFEVGPNTYEKTPGGVTVYDGTENVVNAAENADGQALRVDNKLVKIPQTGGIGTIIFTAIGLAIMASAVIAIKKRQATEAR